MMPDVLNTIGFVLSVYIFVMGGCGLFLCIVGAVSMPKQRREERGFVYLARLLLWSGIGYAKLLAVPVIWFVCKKSKF